MVNPGVPWGATVGYLGLPPRIILKITLDFLGNPGYPAGLPRVTQGIPRDSSGFHGLTFALQNISNSYTDGGGIIYIYRFVTPRCVARR